MKTTRFPAFGRRAVAGALAALALLGAATAARAGTWGPTRLLQAPFATASLPESPLLAMNAQAHALYAWAPTGVLRTADRAAAGGWTAAVPVPGAANVGGPIGVALGRNEVAAVAWVTAATRYDPALLRVALRAPGATVFGSAMTVATVSFAGDVRLAVACDGTVTVVWSDAGGVQAAALPGVPGATGCTGLPGAGPWTAAVPLSGTGVGAALPDLASNDDGAALAVWQEGTAGYPTAIRAAFRPAGGAWGPAETASADTGASTWNAKPGLDAAGHAAVGYLQGTTMVVVRRPVTGGWSAPEAVSGTQTAAYPALAMSAGGDVLAAWMSYDAAQVGAVWHSLAPAGAAFAAPARLSTRNENADWPSAAFAADGSTAIVGWTDDYTNGARAAVFSQGRWTRSTLGGGYWAGVVRVGAGTQAAAAGWAVPTAGNPNSASLMGRYWNGP